MMSAYSEDSFVTLEDLTLFNFLDGAAPSNKLTMAKFARYSDRSKSEANAIFRKIRDAIRKSMDKEPFVKASAVDIRVLNHFGLLSDLAYETSYEIWSSYGQLARVDGFLKKYSTYTVSETPDGGVRHRRDVPEDRVSLDVMNIGDRISERKEIVFEKVAEELTVSQELLVGKTVLNSRSVEEILSVCNEIKKNVAACEADKRILVVCHEAKNLCGGFEGSTEIVLLSQRHNPEQQRIQSAALRLKQ